MSKPIVRIHNVTTDEIVDRDMTDAEFAKYKANQLAQTADENEAKAKATARAALLNKLGITAEEAQLLLA
jgi:hypothetical protein